MLYNSIRYTDDMLEDGTIELFASEKTQETRIIMEAVDWFTPIYFKPNSINSKIKICFLKLQDKIFCGKVPFATVYLYLLYVNIKSIMIVYNHWLLSLATSQLASSIQSEERMNGCILKEAAIFQDSFLVNQIIRYRDTLKKLGGDLTPNNNMVAIHITTCLVSLLTFQIVYTIYVRYDCEFLDLSLSFYLKPLNVQAEIHEEMMKILVAQIDRPSKEENQNVHNTFQDDGVDRNTTHQEAFSERENASEAISGCQFCNYYDRQLSIELHNIVIPLLTNPPILSQQLLCLTPAAYRHYTKMRRIIVISISTIWLSLANSGLYYLFVLELRNRIAFKIDKYRCQEWNSTAIPADDRSLFAGIESSNSDLEHDSVRDYMNSNGQNWIPLYSHELFNNIVSLRLIMTFLEILFFATCNCLIFAFIVASVVDGFSLKSAWTNQVNEQMKICLNRMDRLLDSYGSRFISVVGTESANLRAELRKIDTILMQTYVNFELLRQHSVYYKGLYELVSMTLAFVLVALIYLLNTIYLRIAGDNYIFIFGLILDLVGTINVFFVVCIILSKKFENLHWNINKILSKGFQLGIQNSYMMHLWRRQVLPKEEVETIYATNFVALPMTPSALVSLNSYYIGAIIYLFISYADRFQTS